MADAAAGEAAGLTSSQPDSSTACASSCSAAPRCWRWTSPGQAPASDEKAVDKDGKVVVAVDPRYFRPTEVETLLGDASKAKRELGWTPRTSFDELVREMVECDLNAAKRDALVLQPRLRCLQRAGDLGDACRSNDIPTSEAFMHPDSRIYIAGHRGLVGSAIHRELTRRGYRNLLTRTHRRARPLRRDRGRCILLRLRSRSLSFSPRRRSAESSPTTPIPPTSSATTWSSRRTSSRQAGNAGVKRLLFLGSSCIYPKLCPQPIKEEYLLTGPLEPTNRPYAIAKIAGIEMCWSYNRQYGTRYLAAMPTNLYGPGDNYDLAHSHVLPALIRKTAEAKAAGATEVTVWGTGTPRRELLYSDDLAEACCFLMNLDEARFSSLLQR